MRKRIWAGRGRPRGSHRARDIRILEYLVELATKHGINTREFFKAIVRAWENGKAMCRGLNIQCRVKKRDCAIFLITEDCSARAIAQFPIQEYVLKETNPLKGFDYVQERVRHATMRTCMKERKLHENHHMQIADLQAGMKEIKLRARVIEISKPRLVPTRFFDYVTFANATLADETGKIDLTLWSGRINTISINDTVQIENANVIMFRGEKQLRTGRKGRLKVVETNPIHVIQ